MPRAPLVLLAAASLLAALPARAEAPPPPPPAAEGPQLDVTAHLRATGDGLVLDVNGARLELHASGEQAAAPRGAVPGAPHELRAALTVDGRTTRLVLRFTPPPDASGPDAPPPREPPPGAP